MAYVCEMDVMGVVRKAVRRGEVQGPISTTRDLWVGPDALERCMED